MDLVLYLPTHDFWYGKRLGVIKWLSVLYDQDMEEIESMMRAFVHILVFI